jgi:RecJ-like exonuclease
VSRQMSTPARAQAYKHVMAQIDALSGAKLHGDEQAVVREAADSLIFTHDLRADPAAEQALVDLYALADRMVEAERITRERAGELVRSVEACGPALAA